VAATVSPLLRDALRAAIDAVYAHDADTAADLILAELRGSEAVAEAFLTAVQWINLKSYTAEELRPSAEALVSVLLGDGS
jgi:alkylhydroperoxidase family enzyme